MKQIIFKFNCTKMDQFCITPAILASSGEMGFGWLRWCLSIEWRVVDRRTERVHIEKYND